MKYIPFYDFEKIIIFSSLLGVKFVWRAKLNFYLYFFHFDLNFFYKKKEINIFTLMPYFLFIL